MRRLHFDSIRGHECSRNQASTTPTGATKPVSVSENPSPAKPPHSNLKPNRKIWRTQKTRRGANARPSAPRPPRRVQRPQPLRSHAHQRSSLSLVARARAAPPRAHHRSCRASKQSALRHHHQELRTPSCSAACSVGCGTRTARPNSTATFPRSRPRARATSPPRAAKSTTLIKQRTVVSAPPHPFCSDLAIRSGTAIKIAPVALQLRSAKRFPS